MPGVPGISEVAIDLRPSKYQSSLNSFRMLLDGPSKSPYIQATVRTPSNKMLEVQVRRKDIYTIAFKGADSWYNFDDQQDGVGKSCGSGSNYSHLGTVGFVFLRDLEDLALLSEFKKGVALEKRLCAILFAVVSEASRFATVATYFTGITNKVISEVNFEYLRSTYFNNWTKPPGDEREVGKLYHYTKSDILLARHRS
ncbi:MAG TPA: hypothetical protein VFB43_12425 [Terracidiphilus sp.]|nr:hypothetical protein [Terracidiphilus sp.]